MNKKDPIRDDAMYNIIRTEGRKVTIFMRNVKGVEARKQLKHWKNMARHSGGKVFFSAQAVPAELTPQEAKTVARVVADAAEILAA